jgi:hypothetical protein
MTQEETADADGCVLLRACACRVVLTPWYFARAYAWVLENVSPEKCG